MSLKLSSDQLLSWKINPLVNNDGFLSICVHIVMICFLKLHGSTVLPLEDRTKYNSVYPFLKPTF